MINTHFKKGIYVLSLYWGINTPAYQCIYLFAEMHTCVEASMVSPTGQTSHLWLFFTLIPRPVGHVSHVPSASTPLGGVHGPHIPVTILMPCEPGQKPQNPVVRIMP